MESPKQEVKPTLKIREVLYQQIKEGEATLLKQVVEESMRVCGATEDQKGTFNSLVRSVVNSAARFELKTINGNAWVYRNEVKRSI